MDKKRRRQEPIRSKARRLRRDLRGSIHILEVMVVGLMMMGTIVFVATLNVPVYEPYRNQKPISDDEVDAILDVMRALPSDSTHTHHAHLLEQLVIEHLINDPEIYQKYVTGSTDISTMPTQSELERQLSMRGKHEPFRLELGMDRRQWFITGPERAEYDVPATGSTRWLADTGHTVIVPSMSMYNTNQMVTAELLPAWMKGVHKPAGQEYEITAVLEKSGQEITHNSAHHMKLPTDRDRNPLHITPWDTNRDEPGFVINEQDLEADEGELKWSLHYKLEPSNPDYRWLDDRIIIHLSRPPGWSQPVFETDEHEITPDQSGDWKLLNDDPSDPVWRLQYTGPQMRGPGEGWLNFSMTRGVDALTRHHHVHVQVEQPSWSQATAVLVPDLATKKMPGLVFVSHPDPLPLNKQANITFTIVNPYDGAVTLTGFQVAMPKNTVQYFPQSDLWHPPQGGEDEKAILSLIPELLLPAFGAQSVDLKVKVTEMQQTGLGMGRAPTVEYLGPDYQLPLDLAGLLNLEDHDPMVSVSYGASGQYMAWFDPGLLGQGEHTLRVPMDQEEQIPPGLGHFHVQDPGDPHAVLPVLQEARHSMGLRVSPGVHEPGDPLLVRLDLGELLPVLRDLHAAGDVLEDRVSLGLSSASFVEHLGGRVENKLDVELGLSWAGHVVGLDWVEPVGWGEYDLAVGYRDGRVMLLDGAALPQEAKWRVPVAESLTAGPYYLSGNDSVEDRLVVFGQSGGQNRLFVLDLDGDVIASEFIGGVVEEAVVTRCAGDPDGPDGLVFVSESGWLGSASMEEILRGGNGSLLLGGGLLGSGDSPGVQVHHYQGGDLVSGQRLAGYSGVGLDVGRFGPLAECSLVVGVDELGVMGLLVRYSLEGGEIEEVWRQEVPEGVLGVAVGRVKQAPYEGLLNDYMVDQVVVVTSDGGYRAFGGYVPQGVRGGVSLEGFMLGDELLGLSWVDQDTGYVASRDGFVWRTLDRGQSWGLLDGSPITESSRHLVDFAFGGSGNGLFVQDDMGVNYYRSTTGFLGWGPGWAHGDFLGMGETRTEPGVILRDEDFGRVELRLWDPGSQSLGDEGVLSLSCLCSSAVGHEDAVVGWTATQVRANITGLQSDWVGDKSGEAYGLDYSGRLLETRRAGSPGLYVHDITTDSLLDRVNLAPDVLDGLLGSLNASRSMHGASLIHDIGTGGLVSLQDDGAPVHVSAPSGGVVGLSGGPGASWWVLKDEITPVSQATGYLYQVEPSPGYPSGPVDLSLGYSMEGLVEPAPQGLKWRLLDESGATQWMGPGESASVLIDEVLLVEIDSSFVEDSTGVPVLGVVQDGEPEEHWFALASSSCAGCLRSIGDSGSILEGGSVFLDSDGLLPLNLDSGLGPQHAFSLQEEGLFIVGGEARVSHNASLGLAWRDFDLGNSLWPVVYHRIPGAGDGDVVVAVQGAVGDLSLLELIPNYHQLRQIDPVSGETCSFTNQGASALGSRVFGHHPEGLVYAMGSDLGALSARSALVEHCGEQWSGQSGEVGSVLQFTVPTDSRALPGPTIVQAQLSVDVDGLGEVDLSLLGHSYRSRYGLSTSMVHFNVHLQYWLPPFYMVNPSEQGWIVEPG